MIGANGHVAIGFAIRLLWALAASIVGGALLLGAGRREKLLTPRVDLVIRIARILLVVLSVFWIACWIGIALIRLPYPYELEWVGGSMREACERLLYGDPLYVAPTAGWFPFEYPPLYTAACALLMRLFGGPSFWTMRLVSILATIGCARLLALWMRAILKTEPDEPDEADEARRLRLRAEERRSARTWSLIAAGLFFAAYRVTGAWYDVERLDMLFLFLSLLGAWLLEISVERPLVVWRSSLYAFLAGVALSLAFLTKQQALLFAFAGVGALAWRRAWPQMALFVAAVAAVSGDAVWLLNTLSGGWFAYYCFKVPMANGIRVGLVRQFLTVDILLFLPALTLIGAVALRARRRERAAEQASPDEEARALSGARPGRYAILVTMTLAAILIGLLSRGHWGGYENVLIPPYVFLGTAACVAASVWERSHRGGAIPVYLLIGAQMIALTYRPDQQIPTAANRAAGSEFQRIVAMLETKGPVFCPEHGGVTNPPHFHILGLGDVKRAEGAIPADIAAAIREKRFVAIVCDNAPGPGVGLDGLISRSYYPQESPRIGGPWTVTGHLTPPPPGRIYVLRPRPPGVAIRP
jgi:hypothetical protein